MNKNNLTNFEVSNYDIYYLLKETNKKKLNPKIEQICFNKFLELSAKTIGKTKEEVFGTKRQRNNNNNNVRPSKVKR